MRHPDRDMLNQSRRLARILLACCVVMPAGCQGQGDNARAEVSAAHAACKEDAQCVAVQAGGCSCASPVTYVAVTRPFASRYARPDKCSPSQLRRCATAGASAPPVAVCREGRCALPTAGR